MNKRQLTPDEIKEKMMELGKVSSLNESAQPNKTSTLLYYKSASDNRIYGIVKENHKYFIKVASGTKTTPNTSDFLYVGGIQNKMDESFNSYEKALGRLNGKLISLNEIYKRPTNEMDIPLNKDIDKDKPETEEPEVDAEPTGDVSPEAPVEPATDAPVDAAAPEGSEPESTDYVEGGDDAAAEPTDGTETPEGDSTEEPSEDSESSESGDGSDIKSEIQSLLGKLSQQFQELGDVEPQLAKNAINTIISSTKSGIEKFDDADKEKIIKRIEKDGKKLDEEQSDSEFVIMGKFKNNPKEEIDSATGEDEAKSLTKEYKMGHGNDWKIWYEPAKAKVVVDELALNENKAKKLSLFKEHIHQMLTKENTAKEEKMIMESLESISEADLVDMIDELYEEQDSIGEAEDKLRSVKVTFDNGDVLTTSMAAKLSDDDIKNYYKAGKEFNLGSGGRDNIQKVTGVEILGESDGDDSYMNEMCDKFTKIDEESTSLATKYCNEKFGESLNEVDFKAIFDKAKNLFNKKAVDKVLATDPTLKSQVEQGIEAAKDPVKYSTWKQKVGKSLGMLLLIMKLYGISTSAMASDENKATQQDFSHLKAKIEKVNHTEPDNHEGDGDDHAAKSLSAVKTSDGKGISVDVNSKFQSGQTDLDGQDRAEVAKYLHDNVVKFVQDAVAKNPSALVTFTVDGSASNVTAPNGMTNQQLADDRVDTLDDLLASVIKDAIKSGEIKWDNVKLVPGNGVVGGPAYTQGSDDPHDQKFTDHQYAKIKANIAGADYKPVKADLNITVKDPNAAWGQDRVVKMFDGMKAANKLPKDLSFNDFMKNIKTGDIKIKNQVNGDLYNSAILQGAQQ